MNRVEIAAALPKIAGEYLSPELLSESATLLPHQTFADDEVLIFLSPHEGSMRVRVVLLTGELVRAVTVSPIGIRQFSVPYKAIRYAAMREEDSATTLSISAGGVAPIDLETGDLKQRSAFRAFYLKLSTFMAIAEKR